MVQGINLVVYKANFCLPKMQAILMVISGAMFDIIMNPKVESADTLMLYVDPVIRPLVVALVTFPNSSDDTLCSPFCW